MSPLTVPASIRHPAHSGQPTLRRSRETRKDAAFQGDHECWFRAEGGGIIREFRAALFPVRQVLGGVSDAELHGASAQPDRAVIAAGAV